jgi:hypothetical protein
VSIKDHYVYFMASGGSLNISPFILSLTTTKRSNQYEKHSLKIIENISWNLKR